MNVCILVHSELVSESLWSFARLRAGVSPCRHSRAFMCICITFMYQGASTCILRAFVCIHVHLRAFHVCIHVHSCASTCIHVHVHFLCAFTRITCAFLRIYMHLHQKPYMQTRASHVHSARISVDSRALSRHPCVFLCIRVHLSASQLCAFMRITVHQQCIYCHSHDLPSCPIMSNLPRDVT